MSSEHLTILGGGPAGLAVAYFARKRGLPFTLLEAAPRVGGNCVTFQWNEFRYDSGAHRFHDVHPAITTEVRNLLGKELRPVSAPSSIYLDGQLVRFPLTPGNLATRLGPGVLWRAAADYARERLRTGPGGPSFEDEAVHRYGRTVARLFLLNYSSKLWGIPCSELSPAAAGKRLSGLNLRALFPGNKRGHLDGRFLYPRQGYGTIADKLADAAGRENIVTDARVTGIVARAGRIESIVVNEIRTIPVVRVVNTLPIDLFARLVHLQDMRQGLRYRNLILVALFLDRPRVSDNASVYFPSHQFPFTRVFEPRNRSVDLAPAGKTSLVAERPCSEDDPAWTLNDDTLADRATTDLERIGWFRRGEVIGREVRRLRRAYPVLDLHAHDRIAALREALGGIKNLELVGRNAEFSYLHLHDLLLEGRDLVERLAA